MKLEQIRKPFTTIKDIPYRGTFLVTFNNHLGMKTAFAHDNNLCGYPDEEPLNSCKIPEDNELFATLVSETFSVTGYVLGVTLEGCEGILPSKEVTNFPACCDYQSILIASTNMLAKQTLCKFDDFQIQIGAIVCIKTTTTVSIQGRLFSNVSESIEFIGKLSTKQKNHLYEISGLKMPCKTFEDKFNYFLNEKYHNSGLRYELDITWDNFVENEYERNYVEYVV
jgi:hypothetical protein